MYVFTTGDEYAGGEVELLFTENETDKMKIASMDSHVKGDSEPKKKGAFNNYIVHGKRLNDNVFQTLRCQHLLSYF